MKSKKTIFLERILKFFTKAILKKYNPQIVAITGSVGKTTTKEMIGGVLENFKETRKSSKNFNNEIGLPLTVIGYYPNNFSIIGWMTVFFKAIGLILFPSKYPEILVLEMGADQPGDIKYLCDFVPVSVGILTGVGVSHLEKFKTKSAIIKEKGHLLKQLPAQGLGVYNFDNEEVREVGENINANMVSYGFEDGAQVRATDVLFGYELFRDPSGMERKILRGVSFKLNYQGKIIPVRLNHCIGKGQIYSALAVFAIGSYFDLNLVEIAEILKNQYPVPGRMNLLDGIKKTTVIDDTYNSAPDSVLSALDAVQKIDASRKIVALGDMLELGDEETSSHKGVGKVLAESNIDFFVTVGKRMSLAADEFSRLRGTNSQVAKFNNPMDAGIFIQNLLKEGDLVLVKGSQGMRMEKIVCEIMANPLEKEKLLVRQEQKWQEKEFETQ